MQVEKKARRTRDEILVLVDKAEKLISNGMPKTKAAEEVGLSYPVLQKHLGEGVKNIKGNEVQVIFGKLIQAIEKQVKRDILGKL